MNEITVYEVTKTLIENKHYVSREKAKSKVGVLYAAEMITDEQFTELVTLIDTVYDEQVEVM